MASRKNKLIRFGWVITGAQEAVLLIIKNGSTEELIYTIDGINGLCDKYKNINSILKELEQARTALCNDALLDYQPENTIYDEPQYQTLIVKPAINK